MATISARSSEKRGLTPDPRAKEKLSNRWTSKNVLAIFDWYKIIMQV